MAIKPSVTDAPHFCDEHAAIARLEAHPVAERPGLPALRQHREDLRHQGQDRPARAAHLRQLPQAVHGQGRTLFEDSPIPMRKWWQAVHLLSSGKKGVSSHELHRVLKVTYKTAWFM